MADAGGDGGRKGNPICVECVADAKVGEKPSWMSESCFATYARLVVCLERNGGQMSPCQSDWKEFAVCHKRDKEAAGMGRE